MLKAGRAAAVRASPSGGDAQQPSFSVLARSLLIGHIAFLTLVDLFAASTVCPRWRP
jgi:hypothetical protein